MEQTTTSGDFLPAHWRITWGKEKEEPPEGTLRIYHGAIDPKFGGCTSVAFWSKKGLAAWGVDRGFPLGPIEIRLRDNAVLDEIWTLWMLAYCESGRTPPWGKWKRMCNYCAAVRSGSATDKKVRIAYRIRTIFQIIAKKHQRANYGTFLDVALALCRHIHEQLEAGAELLSDGLLGDPGGEFATYVARAENDYPVYQEDWKERARHFVATLPNGSKRRLLVLDRPESAVFNIWSRDPQIAEGGYQLLLVRLKVDDGKIVLSTDPDTDNPDALGFLLPGLSTLENARRQGSGFDWEFPRGDLTQLAPPKVGSDWGTALSLDEIVDYLKTALDLKPFKPRKPESESEQPKRLLALAAVVLICSLIGAGLWYALSGDGASEERPAIAIGAKALDVAAAPPAIAPTTEPSTGSKSVHQDRHLGREETMSLLESRDGPRSFKRFALIAGVCSYPADRKLLYSCRDAEAIRQLLIEQYGYKEEDIIYLTDLATEEDRKPTARNMKKALEKLEGRADENSSFLFYYSGHGDYIEGAHKDASAGMLLPAGYFGGEGDAELNRGWKMNNLLDDVKAYVASRHIMLMLDCCFSGWASGSKGEEKLEADVSAQWSKRAEVAITASTSGQEAKEDKASEREWRWNGHSAFTEFVLQGLKRGEGGRAPADKNDDGIVTDKELASFVRETVPPAVKAVWGEDQNPLFVRFDKGASERGQFLFVPPAKIPEE